MRIHSYRYQSTVEAGSAAEYRREYIIRAWGSIKAGVYSSPMSCEVCKGDQIDDFCSHKVRNQHTFSSSELNAGFLHETGFSSCNKFVPDSINTAYPLSYVAVH